MSASRENEICGIHDDTIERYAMDKLPPGPTRDHLESCQSCVARVIEYTAWLRVLKSALRDCEDFELDRAGVATQKNRD